MNKLFKTSFIIALIVIITKFFGFGRELVVSYFFGASNITDAFYISTLIPNFFYLVVIQAISVAFIPIVLTIEKEEGTTASSSFSTRLIVYLSSFCLILSALISIFSNQLVSFFAPGFDKETVALSSNMLQIGAWFLLLQSPVAILSAYCQAKKKFIVPALFGLVSDCVYIILVIISKKTNAIYLLGFIPVVSILVEFIIVAIVGKRNGYKFEIKSNSKKYIKLFLLMSIPTIFTVGINQINTYIGKAIASNIGDGVISSYNYAWNICNLYESIFISSICVAVFAELSDLISKCFDNKKTINDLFLRSFYIVSVLIVPLCVFSSYFSKDLVTLIYGRGQFDERAINSTEKCLSILAIGSYPYVLTNLGVRYLYAKKKTLIPTVYAGISLLVSILVNLLAFYILESGIYGICIATIAANFVNFILVYVYLAKKENVFVSQTLLKIVFVIISTFVLCVCLERAFALMVSISSKIIEILIVGILYVLIVAGILLVLCKDDLKSVFIKKEKKL